MRRWRSMFFLLPLAVAGCGTLHRDIARVPSVALERPQEAALGSVFASRLAATPGWSGFHLLPGGQEAFLARAAATEAAQRSLDLQYYLVAGDATATLLLHRAARAAERGVRLLGDDAGSGGNDDFLAALATHPNIDVRIFNPFSGRSLLALSRFFEYRGDARRLDRRMHNKLWIVDNAAAVVDGRNPGDACFAVGGEHDFADLDVFVAGALVREISRNFDIYWNSDAAVPVKPLFPEPSDAAGLAAIPVVPAGYARYRPRLRACGVELQELRPGAKGARRGFSSGASLHAKAVIVDRAVMIVGSMNLDPRSRRANTEVALRIESETLPGQLGALASEELL